jgi:hypothetical protein
VAISPHSARSLSLALGSLTLAAVASLFLRDAAPRLFPARSHDFLAAFSLAMIAVAYMIFQLVHRGAFAELAKAILLAAAFLFWAANQFWPGLPQAALFNDIAIGLFVLDVFLVIAGWPPGSKDSVFCQMSGTNACQCGCDCCDDRGRDVQRCDAPTRNLRCVDAGGRFARDQLNER